jgi:redox-sensitive bicupin YhaK (pirin superfamily)
MAIRHILKTVTGTAAVDGAGVHLVRVIGPNDVRVFDPFLMLDAFDSTNPADYVNGFPWHPHRGIETVTWLVTGSIEHGDSLGNKGMINDGCCQWMTAGSGIIHQEMPKPAQRMLGLQLWVNLPASAKMTAPKYRDLSAEKMPEVKENGARIKVIAGEYRGTNGAMKGDYIDAVMLSIQMDEGGSCEIPVVETNTVFIYILDGRISVGEEKEPIERRKALLLSEGDTVRIFAPDKGGAQCVLFSGAPLREPIAWGGPIVMNTRDELDEAFRELDEGSFIKHG